MLTKAPKTISFILDTPRWFVSDAINPPSEGTHSGCDLRCGAGAVPARGLANRSRAALGPRSSGTMTGPRGARCTGAGEGPPGRTRRFQETRPGAELEGNLGENRGGAPKGERVPLDARPRPKREQVATSDRVARPHGTVAPFRRSASPYFLGGKGSGLAWQSSDADVSRERDGFPSPLAGEDRSRGARSGKGSGIPAAAGPHRRAASRHATLSRKGRGGRASRQQRMRKQRCQHDVAKNQLIVPTLRNG